MLLAGALMGLVAVTQVAGTLSASHAMTQAVDNGIGFTGITVAMLGRGKPWGIVLAALLFGALDNGGRFMEATVSPAIPHDVVTVVEAVVVICVAAPVLVQEIFRLRAAARPQSRPRPPAAQVTSAVESACMTVAAIPVPAALAAGRRRLGPGIARIAMGLVALLAFGLGSRTSHGAKTVFSLTLRQRPATHVPDWVVPSPALVVTLGVLAVVAGVVRLALELPRVGATSGSAVAVFCFTVSFMAWSAASPAGTASLNIAEPAGAHDHLGGAADPGRARRRVGERSGVVNVAIEGEMLFGAFMAALVGTMSHNLFIGVVGRRPRRRADGPAAGGLGDPLPGQPGRPRRRAQRFALGLTGFLYKSLMQHQPTPTTAGAVRRVRIPLPGRHPGRRPALFDQQHHRLPHLVLVVVLDFGLFRTRWGLRPARSASTRRPRTPSVSRCCGLRYRNVILGGAVAGLGGAWLTVGTVGPFDENMSSGKGFIALAAVIFGRWSPLGAMAAAAAVRVHRRARRRVRRRLRQTPIPSAFLSMLPYVVTLFAVAGLVGRVRAPAADGEPYVKE